MANVIPSQTRRFPVNSDDKPAGLVQKGRQQCKPWHGPALLLLLTSRPTKELCLHGPLGVPKEVKRAGNHARDICMACKRYLHVQGHTALSVHSVLGMIMGRVCSAHSNAPKHSALPSCIVEQNLKRGHLGTPLE